MLCGLNTTVPQHLADRFKRYAMGKCNFCRIGMTGHMEDQLTSYTANFGDAFQITIQ